MTWSPCPTRRLRAGVLAVLMSAGFLPAVCAGGDSPAKLRVLSGGYPRAFFFRASESFAANPRVSYERWEATFDRLMGIEGKVLDEEVPGRSRRNIEFFRRFKKRHPEQLVLLHCNGNARDPRYEASAFFAGHWVYFQGCRLLEELRAEQGEATLRVEDARLFRTAGGRYGTSNDDIGICRLDERGRPDWNVSEQVQLLAVDRGAGTIRVRRGCYGTRPIAIPRGRAYAAVHASEGPWGRKSHLLWMYNYSTLCPRDPEGKSCVDVLVDDVARRFEKGGELDTFDGVEFDVLAQKRFSPRGARVADCDGDGCGDGGERDGVNLYGKGVVEFCRRLRQRLGDGKLLLADGHGEHHQRGFGYLNGIESEGWPTLSDWAIRDWSGGLNRHFFWACRGRKPPFSYINHKFVAPGERPGVTRRPDVPFAVHRLVFAAAVFTDSAICYSYAPPAEPGERIGIWDELKMGSAGRTGWLGAPLGPAVRTALESPDLLGGKGAHGVDGIPRVSRREGPQEIRLRIPEVPCKGPDLLVGITARCAPHRPFEASVARLLHAGIALPEGFLVRRDPPRSGIIRRGSSREEVPVPPETGASLRWMGGRRLGGEAHDAYFVHPPYRKATGATFWEREVRVAAGDRLEFFTGMGERSPSRSDGVVFRVLVGGAEKARGGLQEVFEHEQVAARWERHTVPLDRWAGKTVRVRFLSDCGPAGNTTTDHSLWGDVRVRGLRNRPWTSPQRHMTWMDGTKFRSFFYFSGVRSAQVDLEVSVEGTEPFWIDAITAHAAPDVMYREFENGLVVANPSAHPVDFALERRFPERRFRRLRASPRQDPAANNGAGVGATLRLGPREGLFLVSMSSKEEP